MEMEMMSINCREIGIEIENEEMKKKEVAGEFI